MFIFNKIIAVRMDILCNFCACDVFHRSFSLCLVHPQRPNACPTQTPLIPLFFATLVKKQTSNEELHMNAFLLFHLHSKVYNNVFAI